MKVVKKLREVEKLEKLLSGGGKVENNQLQKVRKKHELESELYVLEQRSIAQGGRTAGQLEAAERRRKEREQFDNAAIQIQRVFRGYCSRWELAEWQQQVKAERPNTVADHKSVLQVQETELDGIDRRREGVLDDIEVKLQDTG